MLAKNILVPIDFSDCSMQAFEYACELARKLEASIQLVHCIGPFSPEINMALTQAMIDSVHGDVEQALDKLTHREGVRFARTRIVRLDPRDGILEVARMEKADLIVIGTHGRRGLARFMLGSVAEDVVRRAECPVLTLRGVTP